GALRGAQCGSGLGRDLHSFPTRRSSDLGKFYSVIRNTNMFFENIESVPFSDENAKNQLIGEVYFQRAYNYFSLLRMYGGVPIITDRKSTRLNSRHVKIWYGVCCSKKQKL